MMVEGELQEGFCRSLALHPAGVDEDGPVLSIVGRHGGDYATHAATDQGGHARPRPGEQCRRFPAHGGKGGFGPATAAPACPPALDTGQA